MEKKHAPLQDSVRRYMRETSIAMFLQIQSDISSSETKKSCYVDEKCPNFTCGFVCEHAES